ncbi:MAG: hypothetical protein EB075_04350 [Bacteroidetes bacterium]|nr:hypothetical protein [Bacteroidota bacterium]
MSYASPKRPIVRDRSVQRYIDRQEARGKDRPDVNEFLAKQLDKGRGLSGKVAHKYSEGKYPTGGYWGTGPWGLNDAELDEKYGRGSAANLRALRQGEVSIGKGNVFMGATETDIPRESGRTRNGGYWSTPGRKEYSITSLPKWMVKNAAGSAAKSDDDSPASVDQPLPPGADLANAREAYDRANAYSGGSDSSSRFGSAASTGFDLDQTGGDLYNAIAGQGQSQINEYQNRFLPKLFANANLTAQEIGYAGQQAIAGLPDNLKIPDYDKVFPSKATDKKGIYKWLENRIQTA